MCIVRRQSFLGGQHAEILTSFLSFLARWILNIEPSFWAQPSIYIKLELGHAWRRTCQTRWACDFRPAQQRDDEWLSAGSPDSMVLADSYQCGHRFYTLDTDDYYQSNFYHQLSDSFLQFSLHYWFVSHDIQTSSLSTEGRCPINDVHGRKAADSWCHCCMKERVGAAWAQCVRGGCPDLGEELGI